MIAVPLAASADKLTDQLIAEKKWAEAAIALKEQYEQTKSDYQIALKYAEVLTRLKRRQEALSILKSKMEVLAASPKSKAYQDVKRRMRVLAGMFYTNESSQMFEEGLNRLRDRDYVEARNQFEKTIRKEPRNVEVLVRMAQAEMMLNNVDSATEYLERAYALCPFEGEALLWLGRAYYRRGQIKKSIETLELAREILPSSELAPIWLADALILRRKKNEAITILKKDLDAQPFHVLSLIKLAEIQRGYLQEKGKREALKSLQIAMSRIEGYKEIDLNQKFESDLGYSPHRVEDVEANLNALFQQASSE